VPRQKRAPIAAARGMNRSPVYWRGRTGNVVSVPDTIEKVDEIPSPCGGDGWVGDRHPGFGRSTDAAPPKPRPHRCAAGGRRPRLGLPPPYPPAPPPATTSPAPSPPPPPQAETPPPAPTHLWNPVIGVGTARNIIGSREGTSPSRRRPIPGHWEQRPEGWLWVGGQWSYGA